MTPSSSLPSDGVTDLVSKPRSGAGLPGIARQPHSRESSDIAESTPAAYGGFVFTFIESSIFERVLPVYLDDDEYAELQQYLVQSPEAGEIVPGSGGVRKVRWARPGRESGVGCGSSISFDTDRMSSGC